MAVLTLKLINPSIDPLRQSRYSIDQIENAPQLQLFLLTPLTPAVSCGVVIQLADVFETATCGQRLPV